MTVHQPRGYQLDVIGGVEDCWRAGKKNVLAVLPTGGGKCLGRGTPVLLYSGQVVPVEQVRLNDLLMGPDSKPRRVLSLARGREALYRVTPVKGDPYVVNESHVLSLKRTPTRSNPLFPSQRGGVIVNVAVRDYLAASKTFKHTHKGWRAAVDFPTEPSELPLDPYFLGLWLGDGTSTKPTVTSQSIEVMAAVCQQAAALGLRSQVRPHVVANQAVQISMVRKLGSPQENAATAALRSLNLINNKHVPERYKTGTRAERLALLAGLLDSDGSYDGKGFDVVLINERLMDDLIFVARSLGFSAYKKPVKKTCCNNGKVGDYFRCNISGHLDQIPCRIPRNLAAPRRQVKDVLVTGITVEPIGEGDYFGFEIDGDHLFMLGDFTVTHNTFCIAKLVEQREVPAVCIAHRSELVGQMSVALAREGIRHRVIGPEAVRRDCAKQHLEEFGRTYYDPTSKYAVAGVDTLVRMAPSDPFFGSIGLWVTDEAHHLLNAKENKWGRAVELFPHAVGLGVTATPERADGKGLGRHADGVIDEMVVGPGMRDLIEAGYLTDYEPYAPQSDLDLSDVTISASGDFNPERLRAARRKSKLTGDVVEHYCKLAYGKLGVTFETDLNSALETVKAFRAAGVPAEVISGQTPDRGALIRRFKARQIHQLVSVDVISEGFDLPAIEVVSFARPTQSFSLFTQQFGRALRLMVPRELMAQWERFTPEQRKAHIAASGKPKAIILDHVGNITRPGIGLPDRHRVWSLDRRERRSRSAPDDAIPLRACANPACNRPYERVKPSCPHCGDTPIPAERSKPEFVDGDLTLLDPTVLAAMRGEADRIMRAAVVPVAHRNSPAGQAIVNTHNERLQAQRELQRLMGIWGGWHSLQGRSDAEIQRRFFYAFGRIDVVSAQTLGAREATELASRIADALTKENVAI